VDTEFHDGGDLHDFVKKCWRMGIIYNYSRRHKDYTIEHRNTNCGIDIEHYHQLENIFYFTTGKYLDNQLEELEVSKLVNHIYQMVTMQKICRFGMSGSHDR
jgi:hypothetical protein